MNIKRKPCCAAMAPRCQKGALCSRQTMQKRLRVNWMGLFGLSKRKFTLVAAAKATSPKLMRAKKAAFAWPNRPPKRQKKPKKCSVAPWSPTKPAPPANRSTASISKTVQASSVSFIWPYWSIVKPVACLSFARPRVAWTLKRLQPTHPKKFCLFRLTRPPDIKPIMAVELLSC